jgi:hypothetical protein
MMRSPWPGALLLAVLALAAVAAACGDDDDSKKTPTVAPAGAASRGGDAGGGGSSPGADRLKQIAKDMQSKSYKVTYDLKGDGISGTLTWASKPPKQYVAIEGIASLGSFISITGDTDAYFCASGSGTEKTCVKSPATASGSGAGNPFAINLDDLIRQVAGGAGTTVTDGKGQTIAGRAAKCYDIKSRDSAGSMCVDEKDSIILLVDGTFGGTKLGITAKSLSTDVSDADFTPPYRVVETATR